MTGELTEVYRRETSRLKVLRQVLLIVLVTAMVLEGAFDGWAQTDKVDGIWGNIERFTNTYIIMDGRQFNYAKDVIMHPRSLMSDKRGNVIITLDSRGNVLEISFYGIDMPEAFEKYFKSEG